MASGIPIKQRKYEFNNILENNQLNRNKFVFPNTIIKRESLYFANILCIKEPSNFIENKIHFSSLFSRISKMTYFSVK